MMPKNTGILGPISTKLQSMPYHAMELLWINSWRKGACLQANLHLRNKWQNSKSCRTKVPCLDLPWFAQICRMSKAQYPVPPNATETNFNLDQFGYIYSWWLTPMLDSRVVLPPPKSTLVAGLQVFRNQRSSTSAISDSDSSSSTPWDRLFWGPQNPSASPAWSNWGTLTLTSLRKLPSSILSPRYGPWKNSLSHPDLHWWMFVVYHQQIDPMYLKWAFKSQQKYLESQKQMI